MILGFGTIKGAPGATTLAVICAALWPQPRRLLVEMDTDGAGLAARFPASLKPEPNIVRLVAECRHAVDEEAVRRNTQATPFGFDIVVGSGSPMLAERAASELAERMSALQTALPGTDILCDLGRLRPASPVMSAARSLDGLVVVIRTDFEALQSFFRRLPDLVALDVPILVATVGDGGFAASELDAEIRSRSGGSAALGAQLPFDSRAASAWNGTGGWLAPRSQRRLQRTALAAAGRKLVGHLAVGSEGPDPHRATAEEPEREAEHPDAAELQEEARP